METDKTYFLKTNPSLYKETLKEFSSKPYDLASLNEIIKNSNFNKGSFYYRFNDKFDLYTSLFSEVIVKQYVFIDLLNKYTMNNGRLKSYISILFESQLELYNENPNYLWLLDYFGKESSVFRNQVITITGLPIIDVFSNNISVYLKNDLFLSSDKILIFINQIKLSYYQLITLLDNILNKDTINALVDMLVDGILNNINSFQNDKIITSENMSYFYGNSNKGIHDFNFTLNKCEILAIVGPKASGKTTISNILLGNLQANSDAVLHYSFNRDEHNSQQNIMTDPFKTKININKSLKWNLNNISIQDNNDFDCDSILREFKIDKKNNAKIKHFDKKTQKIIELYLKFVQNSSLIIIDDLFNDINQPEISILSNYLLKCRIQGSTIILTSSHIYNVINIADKIAFLSDGHLIKIKTVDELHQKYGKITHIVKYIDGNNTKIAAFSNENFNSGFFKSIIDQYKLLSLETKTILPDEIFKLETGVNL